MFVIFGTGGHAGVVSELAQFMGLSIMCYVDDGRSISKYGDIIINDHAFIEKKIDDEDYVRVLGVIGIGKNSVRKEINDRYDDNIKWIKLIHPKAIASEEYRIWYGTVICAGATIQTSARIGAHCIINVGAVVTHDCLLLNYVHVGPNATLCGGVMVGEGAFIGAGAVVLPGVKIGAWRRVKAGVVISHDLDDKEMD